MKALLITASLTLSVLAAGNGELSEQSSWETILSSDRVEVDMPTVRMTHGPVTTIDQLCIEGDMLRTKEMFTKLIPVDRFWGPSNDDRNPISYRKEKFYGYANFVQTYTVCQSERRERIGSDWNPRCDYEYEESYTVPTVYAGEESIPVYKIRNLDRDNERRGRMLFAKEYTIPVCE